MEDSGGRYSAAVEGSRYGGACGLKVTVSTAQPHHLRRVPLGCAEARLGIAAVLSYKDEGWGFVGASAVVNGEIVSEEWFGTEALDGFATPGADRMADHAAWAAIAHALFNTKEFLHVR